MRSRWGGYLHGSEADGADNVDGCARVQACETLSVVDVE